MDVPIALPMGRRVVVREFGEEPLEAIERHAFVEDQPPPALDALHANDLVIQIESASVGWVDLLMTSGQYQHMPKPPYVPGLEYAGTVAHVSDEAVRAGAPGAGERVLVDPFLAGPRSMGAYQSAGGFATYAVVPREAVLRVPG
jgi:NADPH2:quinone reductase